MWQVTKAPLNTGTSCSVDHFMPEIVFARQPLYLYSLVLTPPSVSSSSGDYATSQLQTGSRHPGTRVNVEPIGTATQPPLSSQGEGGAGQASSAGHTTTEETPAVSNEWTPKQGSTPDPGRTPEQGGTPNDTLKRKTTIPAISEERRLSTSL